MCVLINEPILHHILVDIGNVTNECGIHVRNRLDSSTKSHGIVRVCFQQTLEIGANLEGGREATQDGYILTIVGNVTVLDFQSFHIVQTNSSYLEVLESDTRDLDVLVLISMDTMMGRQANSAWTGKLEVLCGRERGRHEIMRSNTGREWSRCQLDDCKEALHQRMFSTLCNGVAIERQRDAIGLHGDGGKESKCILIIVVLGIALLDGVECLSNIFIRCGLNVDIIMGTKDDVVAELVRPGLIDDESSIRKMVVIQALCTVLSGGRSDEESGGK
mmetsp:Transcript_2034/g.4458  ORF Transcript_2034/g.4458 Transcript_2034/m.4458 type:complete len:275 (-) Transcript_2034:82-906(-)